MQYLSKFFLVMMGLVMAIGNVSADQNTVPGNAIHFQVIQDQLVFDRSTVDSATLVPPKKITDVAGSDSYGIELVLKPSAANQLAALTQANVGRVANLVLNGKIFSTAMIKSKLGGSFQITGLTQDDANAFIKSLSGNY